MKYIRTKDGIFERKFPNKEQQISFDHKTIEPAYYTVKYDWIAKKDVIKQSDTIEELCDEFVFEMGLEHTICQLTFEQVRDNILNCELESMSTLYGAIWTDKGLIYFARMNDKGELELL